MTVAVKGSPLHAKLARFRSEFGAVLKTGTNKTQHYGFAEAAVIGRRAVELSTEIGLTFVPIRSQLADVRESSTGKQNVFTVQVDFQVTDTETGESIIVQALGQGSDNADKAVPKALSNAMKYGILLLLQAVAEDPEADEETDRRETRERRPRPNRDRASKESVAMASDALKRKVRARQHEVELNDIELKALAFNATGRRSSSEWTEADANKILARLDRDDIVEAFRGFKDDVTKETDS